MKRVPGIARFAISLDRPLVGLGASAPVYYPAIADMLGAESIIPSDADVANAIGAVIGHIRVTATVTITSPEEGVYIVTGAGETTTIIGEASALEAAEERAVIAARRKAGQEEAQGILISIEKEIMAPEVEGGRKLVEARIVATATGRPRMAHPQS
ncbi:Hydantoinase/oxoprolinase [compost metagenome]